MDSRAEQQAASDSKDEARQKSTPTINEQLQVALKVYQSINQLKPQRINYSEFDTSWNMIGEGSRARVYSGLYQGQSVAIKLPKNRSDPANNNSMKHEIHIMAYLTSLNMPYGLPFYAYGTTLNSTSCYVVMKAFSPRNLKKRIFSSEAFSGTFIKDKYSKILIAAKFMHSNLILHGDLKSSNILFDEQDDPVLADYDSACPIGAGKISGTAGWKAPEIEAAFTKEVEAMNSESSEVFALAMLLWQLLTREPVFSEIKKPELVSAAIKKGERPLPPKNCSAEVVKLITWGWAQKAEERPSVNDLLSAVNNLKAEDFTTPTAAAAAPKLSH